MYVGLVRNECRYDKIYIYKKKEIIMMSNTRQQDYLTTCLHLK